MIFDNIDNASRYFALHPGFEPAFEFLKEQNLGQLNIGPNEIAGERLSAMVVRDTGKGKTAAKFEAHNQYIDIQYTVTGYDDIGWENRTACNPDGNGYVVDSDCELFSNAPTLWTRVPQRHFAIFFPEDAHAPMGTEKDVQKVVVKVAVEWGNP